MPHSKAIRPLTVELQCLLTVPAGEFMEVPLMTALYLWVMVVQYTLSMLTIPLLITVTSPATGHGTVVPSAVMTIATMPL